MCICGERERERGERFCHCVSLFWMDQRKFGALCEIGNCCVKLQPFCLSRKEEQGVFWNSAVGSVLFAVSLHKISVAVVPGRARRVFRKQKVPAEPRLQKMSTGDMAVMQEGKQNWSTDHLGWGNTHRREVWWDMGRPWWWICCRV